MLKQQPPDIEAQWVSVLRLLRWDKPAGRFILMIPALWAVFLAAHSVQAHSFPPLPLVFVIVLGSLATSAAGCVVNDLWDRNIDPKVQRTQKRPLASRTLSVQTGIVVLLIAFTCAWGLARYLNSLSFWLCVAAVPVIVLYPLAKRVFPVPQLVLSIAWGFAVLISWTAVTASLSLPAWLLWGATVLWTLGFDTVYAMADRDDDRRIGVNSSALFFGDRAAEAVGIFFAGAVALLALTGVAQSLNVLYWISWAIAGLGWAWHYSELRPRNPHPAIYGRVFQQNVWIGFILLVGIVLGTRF
ncbi:MAG: 4-hydroxybenzoate solanesyltransferase [Synechococcales cyanobacterium T60_A2020_003]|nr:4-hydroxybenzoate solanesyltransferase [Synechococcales cyanobacterium T60_A2020_003]